MAIYRLSADIVRRSVGRTVTAAAAYRAGALIVDARTGLVFDYRRRRGVLHAEIVAPDDAPSWMRDRARLWNSVEAAEKRKDAQLARDIELALPHELDAMQRCELVRGFVRAAFVSAGMVADVALHAPGEDGDRRNHHAHILLTMRRIESDSFGAKERAWNDPVQLETWRTLWAAHVNQALDLAGASARVDHRSLDAQGIDRLPGIHLGPAVIEMQRRGIATERADLAQKIAAINVALITAERGIPTYPAAADNASALTTTRPIVALAPKSAVASENRARANIDAPMPASSPKAVETPERLAASELPRQSLPAFTAPQRASPAQKFWKVVAGELVRRVRALQPPPRRRRSEDTGRAFRAAAKIVRRAVALPAAAYAAAGFLSDTLDWLNLWQGNDAAGELDDGLRCTEPNHLLPHP